MAVNRGDPIRTHSLTGHIHEPRGLMGGASRQQDPGKPLGFRQIPVPVVPAARARTWADEEFDRLPDAWVPRLKPLAMVAVRRRVARSRVAGQRTPLHRRFRVLVEDLPWANSREQPSSDVRGPRDWASPSAGGRLTGASETGARGSTSAASVPISI